MNTIKNETRKESEIQRLQRYFEWKLLIKNNSMLSGAAKCNMNSILNITIKRENMI